MTLKGWFGVSKDQTPLLMEWCDMVASNFSSVSNLYHIITLYFGTLDVS